MEENFEKEKKREIGEYEYDGERRRRRRETWQCNECIGLSGHLCFALVHAGYSSDFSYTLAGDLKRLLLVFEGIVKREKICKFD